MARPIKDTPVLTGDDAVRFVMESQNVKPISQEEREEKRKEDPEARNRRLTH